MVKLSWLCRTSRTTYGRKLIMYPRLVHRAAVLAWLKNTLKK